MYFPEWLTRQPMIATEILISTPPPSWQHRFTGNGYGLLSHPTFQFFMEQLFLSFLYITRMHALLSILLSHSDLFPRTE